VLDGPRSGHSVTTQTDQAPLQLPLGPVTVRIAATGYQPAEKTLNVRAPMVVEVPIDPIPTPPPPPLYRFFGTIRDGLGAPVVGVRVTAGSGINSEGGDCRFSAVTDAAGGYEGTSECRSMVLSVSPPAGFEGIHPYYAPNKGYGKNNFTTKRITQLSWNAPSQIGINGLDHYSVRVSVRYDDGVTRPLGSRDQVTLGSSDDKVIRPRGADGSTTRLEGRSAGTAMVTVHFWGFTSPPVSVRVVP